MLVKTVAPHIPSKISLNIIFIFCHSELTNITSSNVLIYCSIKQFQTDQYFDCVSDANYSDPLGPQMERPKTAAARKQDNDDLFDEDVGDDLLPE